MTDLPGSVISSSDIAAAADQTAALHSQRMATLNSRYAELIRAQAQLYAESAHGCTDSSEVSPTSRAIKTESVHNDTAKAGLNSTSTGAALKRPQM